LQPRLAVAQQAVRLALLALKLPGRYQRRGSTILDVAHNVEAAQVLADNLRRDPVSGATHLVLGMYADKPVEGVCAALAPLVRSAHFGGLPPPRGLDAAALQRRAAAAGLEGRAWDSVEQAYAEASKLAAPQDRILVCGSFMTVAAVSALLEPRP
jgi:dihydrofolate synthase/folylpolyglutamate synthase